MLIFSAAVLAKAQKVEVGLSRYNRTLPMAGVSSMACVSPCRAVVPCSSWPSIVWARRPVRIDDH